MKIEQSPAAYRSEKWLILFLAALIPGALVGTLNGLGSVLMI